MKERKICLITLITIFVALVSSSYSQTNVAKGVSTDLIKLNESNYNVTAEEKLVWLTYRKLELYNIVHQYRNGKELQDITQKNGALRFKLFNFKQGNTKEIQNNLYTEIVSQPTGEIIQLIRSTVQDSANGKNKGERITYGAKWVPGKYSSGFDRNWTIGDILKLETAKYYNVKKYISFEVIVSFEGKSRNYKAIALNHGSVEHPKLEFWDSIVGMGGSLTHIWKEQRLPFGFTTNSKLEANRIFDNKEFTTKIRRYLNYDSSKSFLNTNSINCQKNSSKLKQCCITQEIAEFWGINSCKVWESDIESLISDSQNDLQIDNPNNNSAFNTINWYKLNRQYHTSYGHYGNATFNPNCKIISSSQQRCEVPISNQAYGDEQRDHTDNYYHVGKMEESENGKTGPRGQKIECDSSVGVGFNRCLFSGCNVNLTLSVSGKGLGATATITGAGLWQVAKAEGLECNIPKSSGNPTYECDPYCQGGFLTDDSKSNGNTSNAVDSCCILTPIVVDIDGDGFRMTSASNGVMFDFNGDGVAHRMSWTRRNSDEAWLVLDRNANGMIDNGSELFGNLTTQPQSNEKNGFLALAEYDKLENGGNEDGKINKLDAIFSDLRLWQDKNHNGISERRELKKLRRLDVKAFMLNYRTTRRVDRHGNQFRYKAKVRDTRDGNVGKWAWDVFLVLDENQEDFKSQDEKKLRNVKVYK